MHLFPLSRILAVLVAVAVSSAINPDIDAAHNANPKRCAWNWEVYTTMYTNWIRAISWPMLQVHLHWGTPGITGVDEAKLQGLSWCANITKQEQDPVGYLWQSKLYFVSQFR